MIEIKPCPFCGNKDIGIKLKTDCYSSWVKVTCNKCFAYSECGTDYENSISPNPVKNWKELGITAWNKKVCKNEIKEIVR